MRSGYRNPSRYLGSPTACRPPSAATVAAPLARSRRFRLLETRMWCHFEVTDRPGVYRCAQCGFATLPTSFGPERIRKRCVAARETRAPSLMVRVANYRRALVRWLAAGRPVRSRDEIKKLHAICTNCDHFTGRSCRVCGCGVHHSQGWWNKLRWATEHCPLEEPRW